MPTRDELLEHVQQAQTDLEGPAPEGPLAWLKSLVRA